MFLTQKVQCLLYFSKCIYFFFQLKFWKLNTVTKEIVLYCNLYFTVFLLYYCKILGVVFCLLVLWSPFISFSWHVCSLANKYVAIWRVTIKAFVSQTWTGIFLSSSTGLPVKPFCRSIHEELWMSVCLPALILLSHHTSITPITSINICQLHYFSVINCLHIPEENCHFCISYWWRGQPINADSIHTLCSISMD